MSTRLKGPWSLRYRWLAAVPAAGLAAFMRIFLEVFAVKVGGGATASWRAIDGFPLVGFFAFVSAATSAGRNANWRVKLSGRAGSRAGARSFDGEEALEADPFDYRHGIHESCPLEQVNVAPVVFVVMKPHRLGIDARLQRIIGIT